MSDKARTANWRVIVMAGLAVLLVLDVGLSVLLWQLRQSDPATLRNERVILETKSKLLKADIDRAEHIQKNMPDVGVQADNFYQQEMPLASKGYSGIVGDLGDIATKAGLKTSATAFHEAPLKGRNVTEIGITESVEGSYASVLQFIVGLERSKSFYLLDSLAMDGAEAGHLHLTLELRTYFRT
jgi:type IV pilus assembly protein PilO